MIVLLTGVIGSGKSRFAVHCALNAVRQGRHVVHDLPLTAAGLRVLPAPTKRPLADLDALPVNSLVIADECGADPATFSGAGKGAGKSGPALTLSMRRAWAQSRHRGIDIIVVAQSAAQLTSQLKALVDRTYIMQPSAWLSRWQKKQIVSVYDGCRDPQEISRIPEKHRPLLDRLRWLPEAGLHDLYESIDPGAAFSAGVGLPQQGRPSIVARQLAMPITFSILTLGALLWLVRPATPPPALSAPFSTSSGESVVCSSSSGSELLCSFTLTDGRRILSSATRRLPRSSSSICAKSPCRSSSPTWSSRAYSADLSSQLAKAEQIQL